MAADDNTVTLGAVELNVRHIDAMVQFYMHTIGLSLISQTATCATLGADNTPLVILHAADYDRYPNSTGLFHFALRVPTRADLARVLYHFMQTQTPLQGASDHIVSDAIYLGDPEGNGIEIYWDRPREMWFKDGQMQLATLPMDVQGVLNELDDAPNVFNGLPAGTVMGHMHLHVHDIPAAQQFYRDVMEMDIMFDVGSALFMAYDGYHHHLGANIWGVQRTSPAQKLGLRQYTLRLSDDRKTRILQNLATANIAVDDGAFSDPSGNRVVLA